MAADISQLIQTGFEHHRSGRLREAESIYRSILTEQPQHPDALHLLGVMAHQVGKNEAAADLIEQAIKANPNVPDFYINCGEVYRALHKNDLAISRYEQALAINPDMAGAHNNMGNVYMDLGRIEDAKDRYIQAITIQPDFAEAHNNLGIALKELGKPEESINSFKKALELMPGYAEAYSNLGNALKELGRPAEAITYYEKALSVNPGYAEVHSNIGNALKDLGQQRNAIRYYEKAIDLKPDFAMAHYNLGIALDELGEPEQAIICYEKALTIKPDYAEVHNNMGNALIELGQTKDAIERFERALTIKPDYAEAYRHLSMAKPRLDQASIINKILLGPSASEEDAMHYQYALGNIYNDAGNYEEAFESYYQANKLKRKTLSYDSKDHSNYIDRLIETYSESYCHNKTLCGSESELPVFIVGMPRSGTTLIEQIISSHPQVYGAGELTSFILMEQEIATHINSADPYPYCMRSIDESTVNKISNKYLEELINLSSDAERITDKVPDNFLAVGLIKTLFPNARIIHCKRNAMDTCLSIFFNYFVSTTGNLYTYDLEEIGNYYLDYERLMKHWRKIFSSNIIEVQYEELVQDQEVISKQVIEYLGLEWDEQCLEFHNNKRYVKTSSSVQVRQPMYSGSVNRWKHYEKQLAPLLAVLNSAASG